MHMRPLAFIGVILACVAGAGAADEPPVRSGWYVAGGLGAGWARDQEQVREELEAQLGGCRRKMVGRLRKSWIRR